MVTVTHSQKDDSGDSSRFTPAHEEDLLVYPTAASEYDMVDDYAVETFDDEGSVKTVSSTGVTDQSNADTVDSVDRSDDEMDRLDHEFSSSTAQLQKLDGDDEQIRPVHKTDSAKFSVRDADAGPEPERMSFSIDTDAEDTSIQESEVTIRPLKVDRVSSPTAKPVDMPKQVGMFQLLNIGGLRRWTFTFVTLVLLFFSILPAIAPGFTSSGHVDPTTELAARRQKLTDRLHSVNLTAKADAVLRYPTITIVDGNTVSTKLAFPTEAAVRFVQPDQLFLSLPKRKSGRYPGNARAEVLKDDQIMENVNSTLLIPGVFLLSLSPVEANGNLNISVISGLHRKIPLDGRLHSWVLSSTQHDPINVRLGNRLLQRATYHNAATQVQQSVRHEVSVVRRIAQAVQSEVFDRIQSEAAMLGNWSMSAISRASMHTNNALRETTMATTKLAQLLRTGPVTINRLIRHSMPAKPDVTAQVKRAKSNARAIRGRLYAGMKLTRKPAQAQTKTYNQDKLASLRSSMKQQLNTVVKFLDSIWKRSGHENAKIKASDRARATATIIRKQPASKIASSKTSKATRANTGR
ncbi:hypothetical protein MBLNU457_3880t1 [Dothideomycetes sp. NU457]